MAHKSNRKKYDPKTTPQIAEKYAKEGYLDKQIAEVIGISPETFSRWSRKHSELGEALDRGRETTNLELKQGMVRAASGYDVEETETITILDLNKNPTSYKVVKRKRHIPPSTTMQIFLAKNRMPDEFRDVNRQELSVSGALQVSTLADLMMEEFSADEKNSDSVSEDEGTDEGTGTGDKDTV